MALQVTMVSFVTSAVLSSLLMYANSQSANYSQWTTGTSVSVTHAPLTDLEGVMQLLSSEAYDQYIRPDEEDDVPTTVYIDIFLARLSAFSISKMDFKATLFLRQTWRDKRLVNFSRRRQVALNYAAFQKLWVPATYFPNEKKGKLHTHTVPNRMITLDPDGTIVYSQRITGIFACEFMLHKYPHDNQTCSLIIDSYGYDAGNIVYEWKDLDEVVQLPKRLSIPQYVFKGYTLNDCSKAFAVGNFSCKYVNLLLERQMGYFIIRVYVPSILIVAMSWVAFWIDFRSVPARITLALVTVLTIVSQASNVNDQLPAVSCIKAIDVWLSVCIVFVFSGLIEYAAVNVLARQKKTDGKMPGESTVTSCWQTAWYPGGDARLATVIDRRSRVIFPALFVIFNIIYWSIYYNITV